jgi:MinD superfamily P-loop ATPase
VIINRSDLGETEKTRDFCAEKQVPVILEIPFERKIAEAYSRGDNLIDSIEGYKDRLLEAYEKIKTIKNEAEVLNSVEIANE